MSRHGRKVPTTFYHRFTRDAREYASKYAKGRLISVLEGGYSDRALISGAMAHTAGLVDVQEGTVDESWWNVDNLSLVRPVSRFIHAHVPLTVSFSPQLEKLIKKRRTGKASLTAAPPPWLDRATAIYATIESTKLPPPLTKAPIAPSSRTLRERKPANGTPTGSTVVSPKASPQPRRVKPKGAHGSAITSAGPVPISASVEDVLENMASLKLGAANTPSVDIAKVEMKEEGGTVLVDVPSVQMPKKLPKVILRVKEQGAETGRAHV